ncbi:type II toxin-antitoxin system RelE/ParE family toxin [Corynebacterium ammoniagenes]|uniref:type II toxin-antitoxin system RelE/ParE family toxin n=1 Tax=Corynebacterium ammoniagenes TaxID=1697 RepID=UPI0035A2461B
MIRSFGSKDTERIWHEQYVKRVDRTVQRATLRKLELIHAAKDVEDLRIPPGNRLERWRCRSCRTRRLPLRPI